jgi:hypothetical protein
LLYDNRYQIITIMAMKKCNYCGKRFTGRANARFCPDNFGRCRGAYHRLKNRAAALGFTLPADVPGHVFDMDLLTAVSEGKAQLQPPQTAV